MTLSQDPQIGTGKVMYLGLLHSALVKDLFIFQVTPILSYAEVI